MDRPAPRPFDLRPLRESDLPGILVLEQLTGTGPWSLHDFYGELTATEHFRSLVAVSGENRTAGALLGYAAWFDLGEELHVANLVVHPEQRRLGIGHHLMDGLLREAAGRGIVVTLEVRVSNVAARVFYLAHGFIPVAYRPGYYEDNGEEAVVMWSGARPAAEKAIDTGAAIQ